ncbi:MAG: deoxyribodipyrimidine photo-lyase [Acidimicrobiia bacterium]|nr:deoxyribodipyrimidine photo-lyase [Acidimicrobiia bacterium]
MRTALVLFTCDLRVHDQPALAAAARDAEEVVAVFVLDDAILGGDFARPNRLSYLCDALADLDRSLRRLGTPLVVRRGDVVDQVMAVAGEAHAEAIYLSEDVSAYARRREQRLRQAAASTRIELRGFEGITVVPPGHLSPGGGDHFKVFSPYHRQWAAADLRAVEPAPSRLSGPSGIEGGNVPDLRELTDGAPSPELRGGGETGARRRVTSWLGGGVEHYADAHDDLAGDATSRLSPDLHFGCLSSRELVSRAPEGPGGAAFVRQLAWRDFHHQVLSANPGLPHRDYRDRGDEWRRDDDDLATWKAGRTGIPVVDAGMRQLAREGWMHNRARLVTASFLTKDLYLDWRLGAAHFWDLLVDGDMANNAGNWQWVAGTGNDTRPNRVFNPLRQADRFDPEGDYVRRYVPELAGVEGPAVHRPWKLPESERRALDYPDPMVDHDTAAAEFRHRREGGAPTLF